MIGFFRRIRRKLANQNKFVQYSRYAIGEIVLVMVGILLALQVNTWNETRKHKELENIYFQELQDEFLENKLRFQQTSEFHENLLEDLKKMVALFPINEAKQDTFFSIFDNSKIFNAGLYNPSNSALEAYIRSETFNYLENRELKKILLSWSHIIEDYQEEEKFNADNNFQFLYPFFIIDNDLFGEKKGYTKRQLIKIQNIVFVRMKLLEAVVNSSDKENVIKSIESIIALTTKKD